ncbi:DegT/DnrJ/EryC1/StrS family aminotransferase [Mycobacterium branderi]|uniref:dTDP-4-amino-4,6-dideoxygalactose transaminase n=1 Tax=Mycobacterium branderi TaxID=43348 RepID=A0A7I7WED3_9MYCO|nr:DegT/DnrJ/EryC1/StrS family aminotransferase [Mycobacterium branderi]MCV7236395.1 DegT/DnrJ/EryC1/StrS aminotransferase family protein [Mycobacterium branderi]ORA32571.1 hypothetical protein BST20_24515 [Mycobacterium branderi]BBZ15282.1 hypothetical protein MBRA_54770 [Mycobacterium branderi]
MTELAPETADLRYPPPPGCPQLVLHPSRLTLGALAATAVAGWGPTTSARRRLCATLLAETPNGSAVLTQSGRAALRYALQRCGAGPGARVVLSTFNCPAVADAVLATGATPVLVDFDPDSGPAFGDVDVEDTLVVLTNGLSRDEWAQHGRWLSRRGATPILDLAQAIPSTTLISQYLPAGVPIVLSFGVGKPLGGVGGGAALLCAADPADDLGPAETTGGAQLLAAVTQRWIESSPGPVRAAVARRSQRRPGWSPSKAAHLPQRCGDVPLRGPGRWQTAAAAVLLRDAERLSASARHTHRTLLAELGPRLRCARFVPGAQPCLSGGVELLFTERGHRHLFAARLAALGIQTGWNHYPLHKLAQYQRFASGQMQRAEQLWTRVLTIPKLPQRRPVDRLVDALLTADAALAQEVR